MKKLSLDLTNEEIAKLNYDRNSIKNLLISRAIYNESLEYVFTNEEQNILDLYVENEIISLYIRREVEPRLMVNENQIIDQYNKSKTYFEENNISFKEAHEIIKKDLTEKLYDKMVNDFISEVFENMPDEITISKKELLATKGDPANIKQIIQNRVIKEDAIKNNFYKENDQILNLISSDVRINYFTSLINSKKVELTREEVKIYYENNKKEYENIDENNAIEMIAVKLANDKAAKNTQEYINMIIEKYSINSKVEEILNGRI